MIRGAKAIILDPEDNMLIVYRSKTHPHAPHTPDLPGGKVEDGETALEGLRREISEETGISFDDAEPKLISSHTENDYYGKDYYLELYEIKLAHRPNVQLSYEHEKYEWRPRNDAEIIGKMYSMLLDAYTASRIAQD